MAEYLVSVFSDLAQHSEAWKRIPRKPMVALMGEYRHIAEDAASEFGGIHTAFTGDGHFFLFRDADAAVQFGLTLIGRWRDAFASLPALRDHEPIALRVGAHFGDESELGDTWVGRCGNIAKRIEGEADPDTLFVTEGVLDLIDYPLYSIVRVRECELKGDYVAQRTLHRITEFDAGAFLGKPEEELTASDWFLRAAALIGTDRENTEEEEHCYLKALELRPDYPEAHNAYAVLLRVQDRPKEAEEQYNAVLKLRPDEPVAHYNYANLLNDQNRPEEAEEHYEESLRLRPDEPVTHYNYANLLNDQDRPKEAEEHYREALRLRPDHPGTHYNYAILLSRQDRPKEAEEHYREALRLKPGDPDFNGAVEEERWNKPPPDGDEEES